MVDLGAAWPVPLRYPTGFGRVTMTPVE